MRPGGLAVALALVLVGCSDVLGTWGGEGPLELASVSLPPGSGGAGALGPFTLRFSRSVDAASLPSGISLQLQGRPLAVRYTVHSGSTVRVTPTDPLDFGTSHELVLTQALISRAGEPLDEAVSVAFKTEGSPLPAVSGDSLIRHAEALAHDSMRGRASGTTDELKAAQYLRDRFVVYGLQAPPGGMLQGFSAPSRRGGATIHSRNVLGVLPGSGSLIDQWVVVGGHYDHIGFRGLPDESAGPNNGADDNASGTAVLLEMARVFRRYVQEGGTGRHPRRSVLFAAWGAEEEGLLGSCHYVFVDPAAPVGRTRALVNFDMVGRLRDDVLVVSGGETSKAWAALLPNSNSLGLNLIRPATSAPSGTDHACFWQASVPWAGFFTLTHPQYHSPADDVNLLNVPGMARIGDVGLRVLTRLVVMPDAPVFVGPAPSR